jgi:drug/metabolite transporter (DMT)-like permease
LSSSRPLTLAILTAGLAAVAHGAIFARLADADPTVISAMRTGVAALIVLPIGLVTGWAAIRAGGATVLARAVLGGGFLALHFATWIASLDHTTIVNSAILVTLSPVWLALYAVFVGREPVRAPTIASVALSLAGSLVIALAGSGAPGAGSSLLGDGLALVGGLCFAGYVLTGQRAMVTGASHRLPLLAYLGLCYASAALFLWVAVLALGLPLAGLTEVTWAAMIGAGLVSQVVGHSSYNWALKRFSPRFVAVCLLAEPVVTTMLGYAYFGERVHLLVLAGGAVILAAIWIGARGERPRPADAVS